MKKGKRLLILALILALCAGGYVGLRALIPEPAEGGETQYTIAELNGDDIAGLHWYVKDNGGQTMDLKREGDAWVDATDASFPLDQNFPAKILSALSDVKASQRIDEPLPLSEYGMEDPTITLTVTLRDGAEQTFTIGAQNAFTTEEYTYYLHYSAVENTVWVVNATFLDNFFFYSKCDLVKKEQLPAFGSVEALSVVTAAGKLDLGYFEDSAGLSYTDQYHWFLAKDAGYLPLDTAKATDLYRNVTNLQWQSCVAYKATDEELVGYGLTEGAEAAVVTLQYTPQGGSAKETFLLRIGGDSGADARYAALAGSRMVYTINKTTADALVYALYDKLRPDDVCLMDWDSVTRLGVSVGGNTRSISFDGEQRIEKELGTTTNPSGEVTTQIEYQSVKIYSSGGQRLDPEKVEALLDGISGLKAADYAESPAQREELARFTFASTTPGYEQMTLILSVYDTDYCVASFNNETHNLVRRSDVDDLIALVDPAFEPAEG